MGGGDSLICCHGDSVVYLVLVAGREVTCWSNSWSIVMRENGEMSPWLGQQGETSALSLSLSVVVFSGSLVVKVICNCQLSNVSSLNIPFLVVK